MVLNAINLPDSVATFYFKPPSRTYRHFYTQPYESSSVLKAAKDLSGKLLLLHGTLDDNVHPQNSIMLIDALQKAGHPAQLVLLPGSDHSPHAPQHGWVRYQAMWEFLSKNL